MRERVEGELGGVVHQLCTVSEASRLLDCPAIEVVHLANRLGVETTRLGRITVLLRGDVPALAGAIAERRAAITA